MKLGEGHSTIPSLEGGPKPFDSPVLGGCCPAQQPALATLPRSQASLKVTHLEEQVHSLDTCKTAQDRGSLLGSRADVGGFRKWDLDKIC